MAMPPNALRELGHSDVPYSLFNGWFDYVEETNELVWPNSIMAFQRMRRQDAMIKAVERAVTLPIRKTSYRIAPRDAKPDIVSRLAENLDLPIDGQEKKPRVRQTGRFTFAEHLRLALLSLPYGHMCVDQETEALTQDGWKRGVDLREGDLLLTLNPETQLSEWHPVEKIWRYEGRHQVRKFEGRSHSSVTTLDHNWIVRENDTKKLRFRKTAQLNTNDCVLTAAPASDGPVGQKWLDALVELVAWYFTEGQEHPAGGVNIWQSEDVHPENCARIRAALTVLYGPAEKSLLNVRRPALGWREVTITGGISDRRITRFYISKAAAKILRNIAPGKVVQTWFLRELTQAQLRLFIETAIDADGSRRDGAATFAQKEITRTEPVQIACALLGIPAHIYLDASRGATLRIGKQTDIRPIMNAQRTDGATTDELGTVEDGVWCPTVENHTWLARRRGTVYFTGNCFEQVYEVFEGYPRIKKLAERMPSSMARIHVDIDGSLLGFDQYLLPTEQPPAGEEPFIHIPVDKVVWYVNDREGGNWVGTSILRSIYSAWLLKTRLMRAGVAAIERNSMGVPVMEALDEARHYTPDELKAADLFAQEFRSGERSGGQTGRFHLRLVGVEGALPDPNPMIQKFDEYIARNMLAQFIVLGQQGTHGNRSLGESFLDTFNLACNAVIDQILDTFNQHVVEDWVTLGWGEDEPCPQVIATPIGAEVDASPEALALLAAQGLIEPDTPLRSYLRQSLRLPDENAAEVTKLQEQKAAAKMPPQNPNQPPQEPTNPPPGGAAAPSPFQQSNSPASSLSSVELATQEVRAYDRNVHGKEQHVQRYLRHTSDLATKVDADNWVAKHMEGQPHVFDETATEPSTDALGQYADGAYTDINALLRTGKLAPLRHYGQATFGGDYSKAEVEAFIAEMDKSVPQNKLTAPVFAYRGAFKEGFFAQPIGKLEGQSFEDPGFMSTSLSRQVGGYFVERAKSDGSPMLLRILLPAGTTGRYMSDFEAKTRELHSVETEFILPRGRRFKIVKAVARDGVTYIDAELIR